MTAAKLNVLTALISLAASVVLVAIGQGASGLVWLIASLVWLILGLARLRSSASEPHPMRRLGRRLSRLLLWS